MVLDAPVKLLAGSVSGAPADAVVLDLSGLARPLVTHHGLGPLGRMLPACGPLIAVHWQDFEGCALTFQEWQRIARVLRRLRKPVYVCCSGGHGRTGTALVILLTCLGAVGPGQDPVELVRARYCPKAVETEAQITYLRSLGIETKAKAASLSAVGSGFLGDAGGKRCDASLASDGQVHVSRHFCDLAPGHLGPHQCLIFKCGKTWPNAVSCGATLPGTGAQTHTHVCWRAPEHPGPHACVTSGCSAQWDGGGTDAPPVA
ncbi:MAG: hypothetical protein QN130_12330 [Armatimonadota bacterium]|nr:hypothetical protein [Armatimonadota bacterium]